MVYTVREAGVEGCELGGGHQDKILKVPLQGRHVPSLCRRRVSCRSIRICNIIIVLIA